MILATNASIAQSPTLTSVVNRNAVGINETFMLLVSYSASANTDALDLTPLLTDFDVLASSPNTSSSVSIFNGQTVREETTAWRISLLPKRSGQLTIPTLELNGARSQPITIQVGGTVADTSGEPPLSATLRLSESNAYIGQQIIATVTLKARTNVGNLNGPALTAENADVIELDQVVSQEIENGIAYQRIDLKYALFPTQAGSIEIPDLLYTGIEGGGSSIFSNRGRQIVARTGTTSLTVLPPPDNTQVSPWLVSDGVVIKAAWDDSVTEYKVGEPMTRRITIEIQGQKAEAIAPLVSEQSTTQFQSYIDQPQLNTIKQANGIVGERVESEAIIPKLAGELTLPALSIAYWNPKNDRIEIARLPEESITVLESNLTDTALFAPQASSANDSSESVDQSFSGTSTNSWLWMVMFLSVALVAQHLYWRRRINDALSTALKPASENEKAAWAAVKKAAKKRDLKVLLRAIDHWRATLRSTHSIERVESWNSFSQPVKAQLAALDQALYGACAESELDLTILMSNLSRDRDMLISSQRSTKIGNSASQLEALYGSDQ